MSTPTSDPSGGDDAALPDPLSKELEAVDAELARLKAENLELRRVLGEPVSPAKAARPRRSKRAPGAYRAADDRAALEEALEAANSAVASLSIDNSILQSRVEESGLSGKTSKVGTVVLAALLGLVVLGTAFAVVESPTELGPATLICVTIPVALYASYGWFLFFSSLSRYNWAKRARAQKVTPVAGAPTGQSLVVSGLVQGRDAAFEAWFPEGQRAVWQKVRVTEFRRRSVRHVADGHQEARAFQVVDADGGSIRVEPAGAEVVPEAHSASGARLSRAGQQGLKEIRGFQGERDELSVNIELVRLGATVLVEGRISRDPDPVMRSTRKAPLRIVVLGSGGVDEATRSVRSGLRIGSGAGMITVVCCFLIYYLLTSH